ncbi:MAG: dihydrodipicolinate reductase [Bacteroidetes bacterium CG12_big_fil_rev_8_21_14_0_65_60_17]|nr:MAG: dihydrodipicolinate reductase [Bacteroidetes bacterium CG12_big_fil_rev_8_21_14_0_65_60_17]
MNQPYRVVQYGLGPIGQSCLRTILNKPLGIELVGAIDIDPEKVGKDVAELIDYPQNTGVIVSNNADAVLSETRPDVVVHTTSSFLGSMYDQLVQCARHGAHVISSTEELSFPYHRHPAISAELERVATENGVTILGAGVNPGYAMDALALMATGVCNDVTSVVVHREVNAGLRRLPLQRKVGAGITPQEFEEKKATGQFGHIGLVESLYMIAAGLGWELDSMEELLEPVISDTHHETDYLSVMKGQVAGIHHHAHGFVRDEEVLTLDLKMYVGAPNPRDAVRVEGDPPIDLEIKGGIFGDTATVAALVNGIPLVAQAQPGLKTVADVPLPRAFATTPG